MTIVAHDIGAVGGMERQLTQLVLGLRSLGHRVTVIARTCDLPAGADVVFHRVRGPGRPVPIAHPWFLLAGSLAVKRWRRGVVQATGAIVLNHVDVDRDSLLPSGRARQSQSLEPAVPAEYDRGNACWAGSPSTSAFGSTSRRG